MKREEGVYLEDIIQSIEIIFEYVKDLDENDFDSNILIQDAVYRRFEIIGEATTKITDTIKEAHPEIEWKLMKLMRNKIIHEYFGISSASIYSTIKNDLPELLHNLKSIKL